VNTTKTPQDINIEHFSVWLAQNENFRTPYSEKTKRVYCSVVTGLINFLKKEEISSFKEFNLPWIKKFIARDPISGDTYSPSYQTLRASALNVFWYWLIELEICKDNLVEVLIEQKRASANKPNGGKRPKRLPDVLGWDEQSKLLKSVIASEGRTSIRDYALITLVLASGLRCEEICTLQINKVDLEYQRLRVIGKGNKERLVDFSHDTKSIQALEMWVTEREEQLKKLGIQTEALFISINGKPMTESLVYQQVAKYLKLAGIDDKERHKGSHLLRHTATSIMFAYNVPLLQIQENLGHEQLVTTQIYAHLLPKKRDQQHANI